MTTLYPNATYRPVVNHGGRMGISRGLIEHSQQGNNSPSGWFNNPASQASSHLWVAKSGAVEQYVDMDLEAWAQEAGNSNWHSCEFEGYGVQDGSNAAEPLTIPQINSAAAIYLWGYNHYSWPFKTVDVVTGYGFGWHGMGGIAWGHPNCPGDLRKAQRQLIVNLAQHNGGKMPTATTTTIVQLCPTPTGRGYWILLSDGGVWTTGDAFMYGNLFGVALTSPVSGMVATPTGKGYWIWASGTDKGVFAYGDAVDLGHPA